MGAGSSVEQYDVSRCKVIYSYSPEQEELIRDLQERLSSARGDEAKHATVIDPYTPEQIITEFYCRLVQSDWTNVKEKLSGLNEEEKIRFLNSVLMEAQKETKTYEAIMLRIAKFLYFNLTREPIELAYNGVSIVNGDTIEDNDCLTFEIFSKLAVEIRSHSSNANIEDLIQKIDDCLKREYKFWGQLKGSNRSKEIIQAVDEYICKAARLIWMMSLQTPKLLLKQDCAYEHPSLYKGKEFINKEVVLEEQKSKPRMSSYSTYV